MLLQKLVGEFFFYLLGREFDGNFGGTFADFFGPQNKGSKISGKNSEHFSRENSCLEKNLRAYFALQTCHPNKNSLARLCTIFVEKDALVKNLLMLFFLMGCFPVDFKEVERPLRTKSGKRPIKVGKRPIKEGKRPMKAMVLVGISVGCFMGCFRAPMPRRKTAPLKKAHEEVYDLGGVRAATQISEADRCSRMWASNCPSIAFSMKAARLWSTGS